MNNEVTSTNSDKSSNNALLIAIVIIVLVIIISVIIVAVFIWLIWYENRTCSSDSGCPSGTKCNNGKCVSTACNGDSQCRIGEVCRGGKCVRRSCIRDGQCGPGSICVRGNCVSNSCSVDTDCPPGYTCSNGRCVRNTNPVVLPDTMTQGSTVVVDPVATVPASTAQAREAPTVEVIDDYDDTDLEFQVQQAKHDPCALDPVSRYPQRESGTLNESYEYTDDYDSLTSQTNYRRDSTCCEANDQTGSMTSETDEFGATKELSGGCEMRCDQLKTCDHSSCTEYGCDNERDSGESCSQQSQDQTEDYNSGTCDNEHEYVSSGSECVSSNECNDSRSDHSGQECSNSNECNESRSECNDSRSCNSDPNSSIECDNGNNYSDESNYDLSDPNYKSDNLNREHSDSDHQVTPDMSEENSSNTTDCTIYSNSSSERFRLTERKIYCETSRDDEIDLESPSRVRWNTIVGCSDYTIRSLSDDISICEPQPISEISLINSFFVRTEEDISELLYLSIDGRIYNDNMQFITKIKGLGDEVIGFKDLIVTLCNGKLLARKYNIEGDLINYLPLDSIEHISSTYDGQHLWIQRYNGMGYLYDSNLRVISQITLLPSEIIKYGSNPSTYGRLDQINHILTVGSDTYENVNNFVISPDGDVFTTSINSTASQIFLVQDEDGNYSSKEVELC